MDGELWLGESQLWFKLRTGLPLNRGQQWRGKQTPTDHSIVPVGMKREFLRYGAET